MYDAVVIGGGVVGAAILRELCCHEGTPGAPSLAVRCCASNAIVQAHSCCSKGIRSHQVRVEASGSIEDCGSG